MNPIATVDTAIVLVEQLVQYILEVRAAGQLTDAQLEAMTTALNNATRGLIVQAVPSVVPPAAPAAS